MPLLFLHLLPGMLFTPFCHDQLFLLIQISGNLPCSNSSHSPQCSVLSLSLAFITSWCFYCLFGVLVFLSLHQSVGSKRAGTTPYCSLFCTQHRREVQFQKSLNVRMNLRGPNDPLVCSGSKCLTLKFKGHRGKLICHSSWHRTKTSNYKQVHFKMLAKQAILRIIQQSFLKNKYIN